MDDYQYQSKPAIKKTQWPNALGYKGSLDISGLAGRSSSAYGSIGSGVGSGSGADTGGPGSINTGNFFIGDTLPPSPGDTGTFVLGYVDGELGWIETTDCGATGATGAT